MKELKTKQETAKFTYEEYVRDPIACGYTLVEKDGEQFYSQTYQYDNVTVVVYRPVLAPEERKKREKQLGDTLVNMYRNMYRRDPELANKLLTSELEEE